MIKISVITSLYKCEKYLASFLVHYFNISNKEECELILVHNDPSEEELCIIQQFDWKNTNLIHLKVKREGLYNSWNRAAAIANGEYLAVWNVDDIRTPNSLLSQKKALDNSQAVMCYGDFYGTNRYGTFNHRIHKYETFDKLKKYKLRRHIIGCFPMWRKSVHKDIGYFDEQFRLVSDFEFQLRVIQRFDLVKADEILGYYLEFLDHKLSSNRFLQDKERTVVEIRYKIYEKILMHTLPFILNYRINYYLNYGEWYYIADVIPNIKIIHFKDLVHFVQMPFAFLLTFLRRSLTKIYRTILNKPYSSV